MFGNKRMKQLEKRIDIQEKQIKGLKNTIEQLLPKPMNVTINKSDLYNKINKKQYGRIAYELRSKRLNILSSISGNSKTQLSNSLYEYIPRKANNVVLSSIKGHLFTSLGIGDMRSISQKDESKALKAINSFALEETQKKYVTSLIAKFQNKNKHSYQQTYFE